MNRHDSCGLNRTLKSSSIPIWLPPPFLALNHFRPLSTISSISSKNFYLLFIKNETYYRLFLQKITKNHFLKFVMYTFFLVYKLSQCEKNPTLFLTGAKTVCTKKIENFISQLEPRYYKRRRCNMA